MQLEVERVADRSRIEWTDATWNPVTGCSKVSAGCAHCYAERLDRRFRPDWRPWTAANAAHNVRLHPERLDEPLRWRKPRRVFVNSMSDLFHELVPFEFIDRVFAVMAVCREHTFQVLTKRPARMLEYLTSHAGGGRHVWPAAQAIELPYGRHKPETRWPLPNVWLGVSVEDQRAADERIPMLLRTPAAVRFLSCEPLLGPVDLSGYLGLIRGSSGRYIPIMDEVAAAMVDAESPGAGTTTLQDIRRLHWVIVGGESGPGARPMHPDWARSLRDQCVAAGVPFFFKQRGEWTWDFPAGLNLSRRQERYFGGVHFYRVGTARAGRELDGRTWDEMPAMAGVMATP